MFTLEYDDFYNHLERITDVYYAEIVEMFKKVTGAAHAHIFHHLLRAAKDTETPHDERIIAVREEPNLHILFYKRDVPDEIHPGSLQLTLLNVE